MTAPLDREVAAVTGGAAAEIGAHVEHSDGTIAATHHGELRFVTASTFKVMVLVALMREVDAGHVDLHHKVTIDDSDLALVASACLQSSPSVREYELLDLATQMIVFSDNAATDAPLDGMRDPGGVAFATEPPNDYTTPREMARLLLAIWKGSAASRASCDLMLDIMKRTMTYSRIGPGVPFEQPVHHKTGTPPGIYNDVGLLPMPDGSALAVALFSRRSTDSLRTAQSLYAISEKAWRWGLEHTRPVGLQG